MERKHDDDGAVAPHAGAWIEISPSVNALTVAAVAPHAGAWIEIKMVSRSNPFSSSRPTRARGLKFQRGRWIKVAPHAGAWIEMPC